MAVTAKRKARARPSRPLPPGARLGDAFARLARERALQTLVRGALSAEILRRMLKDAFPPQKAREMPPEIWASLAAGFAYESPVFGGVLAQALHDRLAWDREPQNLDGWWELVRDRPLEALWMAALSENRTVRKEFAHIAQHAIENYRSSPQCEAPSWGFVEGLVDLQADTARDLRDAQKQAEDAERRFEAERDRLEELRDELKRLRRENADLRGGKAQAERRAALAAEQRLPAADEAARRLEELERRLRKAEKEREHLVRELERRGDDAETPAATTPAPSAAPEAEPVVALVRPSLSADPNPRRRVLRQMLRKLFKKGKIGASHTHEDNVFRGLADHEKGIAKQAMDLLYREGYLRPKPTTTDPHVSLSPDRTGEVRAIIAGEIDNPRLQRFVEG